ncbi:shikimate kinase [Halovenus halobia]|uniref:shikimate kinase n=1 Tax=Halovenus halobia TaxID=3396622 RepID=UPI003F545618
MDGQAKAPAAGTVLNALATGTGAAFAIEEYTTATVELDDATGVTGHIDGVDDGDTRLIERCVELVAERFGDGQGGYVETASDVPMASGLKSSSAAANATVMATLAALGATERVSREDAARIGVEAARDVGVTVTGAFDDASASMLGGLTVTNNDEDELLARDTPDWDVLVWTPPEQSFSADADVERCRQIAPIAEVVADLALDGQYHEAMSINGLAFCAALGFPTEPMMEAMDAAGVSLSGTGPSFVAVGTSDQLAPVRDRWERREGTVWLTHTQTEGTLTDV